MPIVSVARAAIIAMIVMTSAGAQPRAGGPMQADDPDARPPVSAGDLAIATRASHLLDRASVWNRRDDRRCPVGAPKLSIYCALERATVEAKGDFGHRDALMQEARFTVESIEPAAGGYAHRLMDFNNDPRRKFADIEAFFRILESRLEARLRERGSERPAP